MKHPPRLAAVFCAALIFSLIAGCASPEESPEKDQDTTSISITDYTGTELTFTAMPARVAALSASFGEIWLNAGGQLVGVTNDALTERNLSLSQDVSIVGTIKDPDLEALLACSPDFVILSADISSHVKIAETLRQADIACGLFHVEYFEDYLSLLDSFCRITGREDLYEQNGLVPQQSIEQTLAQAPDLSGKTVLLLRAYSSGFKAKDSENMAGTMLSDFGLINILDKYDSLMEDISLEEILSVDPDYIFITTMGSDQQAAIDNLESSLTGNPAWSSLQAVSGGRCFILPQDLFHYKPNARWGESYEYLNKLFAENP